MFSSLSEFCNLWDVHHLRNCVEDPQAELSPVLRVEASWGHMGGA